MARPKGSGSLASRLMAGVVKSGGIYEQNIEGRQVYLYATWKWREPGKGVLRVQYVGCGMQGRSQHHQRANENPEFQKWLKARWVPRTLLFAKPRRLENHSWLEQMLAAYSCAEGLVVFETPFLKHAFLVEGRLIEIYQNIDQARLNRAAGEKGKTIFKPSPNRGKLREHATSIRLRKANGEATNALAREFGVDPSSIRDILKGKSYKSEDEPIE